MGDLLMLAFAVPLFTGAISIFYVESIYLRFVNLIGSLSTSTVLFALVYQIMRQGACRIDMFFLDELSAVLLLIIGSLGFTSMLFSFSYMEKEVETGQMTNKMLSRYYGLFHAFIFTMIAVVTLENVGLMWVAVEATTLASAFLVAFYFKRSSLEAAWKYVMVCTVGICLALLGTILLYYAQVNGIGGNTAALSWQVLYRQAAKLNPELVKLAFVFIFIGYATKAGLAPMHTWLPDAHSQAPSPVSALLSGALLSCAMYALVRNWIIVQAVVGGEFGHTLFITFGLLSIFIAVPFVLVQSDIKRLLAYSSVEHMGIISVGLGIGTPLAVYGALLHMLYHAVAKSALFYLAGYITQVYKTKQILRIRALVHVNPVAGILFVMTVLAITGTPPFAVFISKFTIVWAAFTSGLVWLGWLLLLLLAGVFSGLLYYCLRIGFGASPARCVEAAPMGLPAMGALILSMLVLLIGGFYLPPELHKLLQTAAQIVTGGGRNG